MADFLRKVVVISAVLSLLLLASGCATDSGDASTGLSLPDNAKDSQQPPALPSDADSSSPPAPPAGESGSPNVPLFG